MTVTNIFHDRHLPVDKTSIVTTRGSAVVSGPAVSKKKNQNKIKFHSYLPIFLGHVIGNQQNYNVFFCPIAFTRLCHFVRPFTEVLCALAGGTLKQN
jgi:hypothetical protein